jgi:hypothetical protein
VATIAVTWTNYGSAAATEKWIPTSQLVDFSGAVIRTVPSTVVLKNLVSDEGAGGQAMEPSPAGATESVAVDLAGLPRGTTHCGHRSPGNSTNPARRTW